MESQSIIRRKSKGGASTAATAIPLDPVELRSLFRWSSLLALVHGASAAGIISLLCTRSFKSIPLYFNTVLGRTEPVFYLLAEINVLYFLIAFEVLAAFRLFLVGLTGGATAAALEHGLNPYRWLEYSASASCMTVAIAMLSGVIDVVTLYVLFALTALTMLCGHLSDVSVAHREVSFELGGSAFILTWGVIYVQFIYHAADIPWFVYAINVGVLVAELAFPYVQYQKITNKITTLQAERRFLVLELASKLYLAWVAVGGMLWF